jgi:hypothetical protein
MPPFAIDVFFQSLFGVLLAIPVIILWVVAVIDVFRHHYSGLKVAAVLVLILIVPILGPILYFVFVSQPDVDPEAAQMADAELRRQAADRPVGGMGVYR